ncbi:SPAG6 [Symbiodinium sp. KB8]|nr:SPAG6 [Symbiodinium sp. KB8]
MALGYISAYSESLALAVIVAKGVPALKDALINEPEDHIKAATVWTLGQIGRHTPDHAKAMAESGVLLPMVVLHVREDSSADLKTKAKRALKAVLVKCTDGQALAPLLKDANPKVRWHRPLSASLLFVCNAVVSSYFRSKNTFSHSMLPSCPTMPLPKRPSCSVAFFR